MLYGVMFGPLLSSWRARASTPLGRRDRFLLLSRGYFVAFLLLIVEFFFASLFMFSLFCRRSVAKKASNLAFTRSVLTTVISIQAECLIW
jgi:hypothetical protein